MTIIRSIGSAASEGNSQRIHGVKALRGQREGQFRTDAPYKAEIALREESNVKRAHGLPWDQTGGRPCPPGRTSSRSMSTR
jgi:hypothetical protein